MINSAVFLTKEEIQAMVLNIAQDIDKAYKGIPEPLILIGVLKGAVFFLSDLARGLKTNSVIDFVLVESLRGGFSIAKDIALPVQERHILIVKEVLNSGRKILFLKKRLEAGGAKTVKTAVLLDKPARRSVHIQPDFSGRVIEDRYLFGYGMDHEEKYRGFEDIRHFTQ